MKYPMTFFYLLDLMSHDDMPEGFLDQPYQNIIRGINENPESMDQNTQLNVLSYTNDFNNLIKDGYFEDKLLSVQGLFDELMYREPESYETALSAFEKYEEDSDD